jgi:hypothetical protein
MGVFEKILFLAPLPLSHNIPQIFSKHKRFPKKNRRRRIQKIKKNQLRAHPTGQNKSEDTEETTRCN